MLEGFVNVSALLGPGVYALLRDGVVVYIGQSKRCLGRVSAHKSNWGRRTPSWLPPSVRGILFDEVHVFPCRVEALAEVEAAMINLYKPRYNIRIKTPEPVTITHLFATAPPPPIHRRF